MRLEINRMRKTYGGKTAVDIGHLTLDSGKIVAVLGPNGSGKTTLLRLISGIDQPDCGKICYDGIESSPRSDIAYMPQSSYMFDMTALENVLMGIKKTTGNRNKEVERAKEALVFVGMEAFSNSRARSLSGGEAQRIALARTLVLNRKLVLLDEPASATDVLGIELIEAYMKQVARRDKSTMVFTTHNPSQAIRVADEVIFMCSGKIIEKGEPSSVFSSPQERETRDFLKSWRI